jgi:HSP20 family molecular chaperone IbpA
MAARQFLRSFVLADGIEVAHAALENGLLRIDLSRPPAQARARTIEIKSGE